MQTIRRANRKIQLVDSHFQQFILAILFCINQADLVRNSIRQANKQLQIIRQDTRAGADSLIGSQCTVCPNVQCQLIKISVLADAGVFHTEIYLYHRREQGVNRDNTDRLTLFLVLLSTDIASALVDGDGHKQAAIYIQVGDMMSGIHNLHIRVDTDIGSSNLAGAVSLDKDYLFIRAIHLHRKPLQVQDDISDILHNTRDSGEFMQNSLDLHRRYCSAGQGRQ